MSDPGLRSCLALVSDTREAISTAVAELNVNRPVVCCASIPVALAQGDAALERVRLAMRLILRDPEASELSIRTLAVLLLVGEARIKPSVSHVAAHLQIGPSVSWKAFYALETRDLLAKVRNPMSSRLILYALTEKGHAFIRRAGAAAASVR